MTELIKILNLPTQKTQDNSYKVVQLTYLGIPLTSIGWPRHDQHHMILERFLLHEKIEFPKTLLQLRRRPVLAPALESEGIYKVNGIGKLLFDPTTANYEGLVNQRNFYNLKLDPKLSEMFDEQMRRMGYTKKPAQTLV